MLFVYTFYLSLLQYYFTVIALLFYRYCTISLPLLNFSSLGICLELKRESISGIDILQETSLIGLLYIWTMYYNDKTLTDKADILDLLQLFYEIC